MNITEFMSFDLEWFTTPEGLLITGGVIVLLIALIIFIVSNKKTEKKVVEEAQNNNANLAETPEVNMAPSAIPVNEPAVSSMNTQVMPENNVATMDFANPGIQNGYVATPMVETPAVKPIVENPDYDNAFRDANFNSMAAPVVETPVVEPVTPVVNNPQPYVAEVAPVVDANAVVSNNIIDFTQASSVPVNGPVMPEAPVVETVTPVVNEPQPYVEEKPMIYGGVSPVNTFTANEPVSRPVIYGGADPLENTTTLPKMNNHEAYSATPSVAPMVEPTPVVNEPQPFVAPTAPVVEQTPYVAPAQPVMPMTGAEMFATNDIDENNGSSSSSSDIETLEF